MSFPLPDDILQSPHIAFKQIMQEVKNHQNGAVSRQMQSRGLNYKLNYGVAVPLLKNIATDYKKDNALATQLWNCGIREGLLLATFLFEADKLSSEKAINISVSVNNIELVEQSALNLFAYLPALDLVVEELLKGNQFQNQLAFYAMSWGIKRKTLGENYYDTALEKVAVTINSEDAGMIKGLSMLMQTLISTNTSVQEAVFGLAENMKQSPAEAFHLAGKEFLWLHRD